MICTFDVSGTKLLIFDSRMESIQTKQYHNSNMTMVLYSYMIRIRQLTIGIVLFEYCKIVTVPIIENAGWFTLVTILYATFADCSSVSKLFDCRVVKIPKLVTNIISLDPAIMDVRYL